MKKFRKDPSPINVIPLTVACLISCSAQAMEAYKNPELPAAERARDLVSRMTLEEKLISQGGINTMNFQAIPRLGLPAPMMSDASQGIRLTTALTDKVSGSVEDQASGVSGKGLKSLSFPGMLPMAGTWNPELAKAFGEAMGEQCRALGVDILLGPGINMYRTSAGGRAFEYMGEDPHLTAEMVVPYVQGVQSKGVMATPKHFICNDTEFCRHMSSSQVGMRTLREIYLPPWEAVIKRGKALAMMTGNNQINNVPACMNKSLLQDILRAEYGFTGMCMSDWQNTNYYQDRLHLALTSGHSLYMPTNDTFRKWFKKTWETASADRRKEMELQLDAMILNNFTPLFACGYYDRGETKPGSTPLPEAHKAIARKTAEEALCLLKNEGSILPLKKGQKILYIGEEEIWTGKGSGFVEGYDHTSFRDALRAAFGSDIKFAKAKGANEEQFKWADVVLYNLNKEAGEGRDIPFELVDREHKAIEKVLKAHDHVVILATACSGFDMPWIDDVDGLLWCYFLGQERGNALIKVLTGEISPSGKLPFSIEKTFADSVAPTFNYIGGKPYWLGGNQYKTYWLTGIPPEKGPKPLFEQFIPNYRFPNPPLIPYTEGIFIGYRWFDKKQIEPQFPFGFGLSYTTFDYSDLKLSTVKKSGDDVLTISFTVTNTGKVEGKEVTQLYIQDVEASVERPPKEMKGFDKVSLQPGESKTINQTITKRDLSFWDTESGAWKAEPGEYKILIGASSADIRLNESFVY